MTKTERLLELLKVEPLTTGELVKKTGLDSGAVSALLNARRKEGEVEKAHALWRYLKPPPAKVLARRAGSKFSIYEGAMFKKVDTKDLPRMFAGAGAATALLKPIRDGADEYRQYPSRFGSELVPYMAPRGVS